MGSEFEVQEKDDDETTYPHDIDIPFPDVSKDAAEEQGMEMEGDEAGEGRVCILPETLTAEDGRESPRKRNDERRAGRRRQKLRERWSSEETFALIACKRKQMELFGDGGPGGRINAKERKWHDIQKRMAELGVQRTAVECTRRWDNLLSWYKRIVDNDRREDVKSFWEMTPRQRRDHGLKFAMERSVFDLIDSLKLERRANLVRTISSAVNTTAAAPFAGALDRVINPTANALNGTPTGNLAAPLLLSPSVTPALNLPITRTLDPLGTPPTNPAVGGLLTPSLSPAINPPVTGALDPSAPPTVNSMVIGTLDHSVARTINLSLIRKPDPSITPAITDPCTAPAVEHTFSAAANQAHDRRVNRTANLLDSGDRAEIFRDDTGHGQATDPNTIRSTDTDSQSPVIDANERRQQMNAHGQPRVRVQDAEDANPNLDNVAAAMMGSDNGEGMNEHTQHNQSEGHPDASQHTAQHTPPPFVPSRKRKHVREVDFDEMLRAIETHTSKMVTSVGMSCNRSCETIMQVGQMQCDALREGLEVQRILAMNVAEAGRLISEALMVVAEKLSSR
ncbi:hypothetical protein CBR_g7998 [Chara braunii]|uniref:Myb-like domain-containing protein n=1 Tax=Chara braunii TaxID=69332 RepID=A0A388KKW3_CHABU|nr:hypothetical protein CBR_g7998 [Chara braunii]|eukprot:GBG70699.1 hypothetical protein CBR_g7998 [Chara braunii]